MVLVETSCTKIIFILQVFQLKFDSAPLRVEILGETFDEEMYTRVFLSWEDGYHPCST